MPIGYFIKEGLKIVLFHKKISILAIGVIALAIFFMGFFLLIAYNLEGIGQTWEKQQKIIVYLDKDFKEEIKSEFEKNFTGKRFIKNFHYQSKEDAFQNFKKDFPSLIQGLEILDENPFLPSYEIFLIPGFEEEIKIFVDEIQKNKFVQEVQYDLTWLQKLNTLVFFLKYLGIALGVLLGIGAIIIVTNVVRIATLIHKDEMEILWLMGTPPSYIRGPFIFQGIYLGFGGGILSIFLIYTIYQFFVYQIKNNFQLLWNFMALSFLPFSLILILLLCGVFCGLLGSLLLKFESKD